jgi:signal peptidase I
VPKGDYFVLGDNRNESDDSRYWGFVPRSYIVGEPIVVYFSWREPQDGVATNGKNLVRWDRTFQVVK